MPSASLLSTIPMALDKPGSFQDADAHTNTYLPMKRLQFEDPDVASSSSLFKKLSVNETLGPPRNGVNGRGVIGDKRAQEHHSDRVKLQPRSQRYNPLLRARRTPHDHFVAAQRARFIAAERERAVQAELLKSKWAARDGDIIMADVDRRDDYDRRGGGGYGGRGRGGGGYKRRYREDDEERYDDRRPQRRREERPAQRVRTQILTIAETPLRDPIEDCAAIAKNIENAWDDEKFREIVTGLVVDLIMQQPLKTPYVAAIILYLNEQKPDIAKVFIDKTGEALQSSLESREWRSFKLLLRFLACMHGLFEENGALPLLDDLFNKAADLQTADNDDALGLELVKVIMLTIPYLLITSTEATKQQATELLGKTEIIALAPSNVEETFGPYAPVGNQEAPQTQSVVTLLQKQLQAESDAGWPLAFIPRLFKPKSDLIEMEGATSSSKHAFPVITLPSDMNAGAKVPFPEVYFSLYADQDVETVPATTKLAACVIRDALVDTINSLHINRNVAARFLIDLDCYWAPNTFIKRATPFDKVRDAAEEGRSTWKPEDLAIDAVFSQIATLPSPEHKLVYYHSIITETCKLAPGSIAPSLGRAIRFIYRSSSVMDQELHDRFQTWFAHHLSNFDFRWKWAEWSSDIGFSNLNPKKAFIVGSLDKEIRLSFAKRIRDTLPEPYHVLIPATKDQDEPKYKYDGELTPHASSAKKFISLIRARAPDADIQAVFDEIEELETSTGTSDPTLAAIDAYVTTICSVGAKSLSHVLSIIERCKGRLTTIGQASPSSRYQIISSVVAYWHDVQIGSALNIVDKLLNYTILTPSSVIQWALDAQRLDGGRALSESWVYEMVDRTMNKVVGRVGQIVAARMHDDLPADQIAMLDAALAEEVQRMRSLFAEVDDALAGVSEGAGEGMLEDADTTVDGTEGEDAKSELEFAKGWGVRWRRVWQRKLGVQETVLREAQKVFPGPAKEAEEEEAKMEVEMGNGNGGDDVLAKGEGEDEIM